jgi:glutathionylspermidine synthase
MESPSNSLNLMLIQLPVFETAVVQWASLKANRLDETLQFNTLYESLVAQFGEMRKQNPDHEPTLLISTMEGYPEDDTNMQVLGEAAREAGFEVAFEHIERTEFSSVEGIYKQSSNDGSFTRYDYWFKLVPWEYIGWDEPELAQILTDLVTNEKTIVLNPAYTLLFQSKGILKILWQLFPNHPLLLETASTPLVNKTSVEKVLLVVKVLMLKSWIPQEMPFRKQKENILNRIKFIKNTSISCKMRKEPTIKRAYFLLAKLVA